MNKKIYIFIGFFTLAFLIVTAVLLLNGPRMRTQASIRTFEAEMPSPPEGSVPYYAEEKPVKSFSDLEMPAPDRDNIRRGETYYGYYCIFCHGSDGKGNGPVGESYMPRPTDLGGDTVRSYTDEELYEASFKGTGHSPVLERVVPDEHRAYLLIYMKDAFR